MVKELRDIIPLDEAEKLGSIHYTQAKKHPDGAWRLHYRGTRNEVFPNEKFKSASEAKQYFKAMKIKRGET